MPKPVLALPIGHHASLRRAMSDFSTSLLSTDPPISGLDRSIITLGRRLHFTLGVMALDASKQDPNTPSPERPTLEAAIAFLHSLKPKVDGILAKLPTEPVPRSAIGDAKLRVTLNTMDVMSVEKNDMAHVAWIGPEGINSAKIAQWETKRLREICDFIHSSFEGAGFLLEERKPFKLHCTIINTVYRKPKPRGGHRLPFSYKDLVEAPWFHADTPLGQRKPDRLSSPVSLDQQRNTPSTRRRTLRTVNFGTYDIDEVQICEMGSWGPEGEYVCVGSITLG